MKWKPFITGALILATLAAAGMGLRWWKQTRPSGQAHGGEPAEAVEVVETRTAKWRPTATLVGTVFALRAVTVSNEIAGTVKQVPFESGATVEAGDLLLSLDTSTEESDLSAAQAAIRVFEAGKQEAMSDLRLAEANWQRIDAAREKLALTEMELDKARAEVDSAKAKLERAAAELDQARARASQVEAIIGKKRITAPFKGRVGIHGIQPGQYLKEGTEVFSLQGIDDRAYLDFALPQEQAWRVTPGASFMATSPLLGPEPFRIEVVALDAQVDMATRNVRVRSSVDNSTQVFRAGMSVEVSVPIDEERESAVIPGLAVRHATYGDHVFVVAPSTRPGDPPGSLRASQRFVTTGAALGTDVVVEKGLAPGERIASLGSFKLRDGSLVTISAPAARTEGPGGAPGN